MTDHRLPSCARCLAQPCACPDGITLYVGDALDILPALEPVFHTVLTDPPYSSGGAFRTDRNQTTRTKYQNRASRGRTLYSDFSGDSRDQRAWTYWTMAWARMAMAATQPGGILATFSDWRQIASNYDAVQAAGWVLRGLVTWNKSRGRARPVRGRFQQQAEFVVWASKGALPNHGPNLPGCYAHTIQRKHHHLTEKPLPLLIDLARVARGPILDPFAASGTTLLAAREVGRPAVGIELDPRIAATAVGRLA